MDRHPATSVTGVIRTSKHAGSKPGYVQLDPKGSNVNRAVTRTRRAVTGRSGIARIGHVPGQRKRPVYKKDLRLTREYANERMAAQDA
jgi:hypothetical protein